MLQIFTAILAVQVLVSGVLHAADYRYPFSGALSVARHIESATLGELPVAVTDHSQGAAIAGYLGRPVYRLDVRTWGRRTDWGAAQERYGNVRELLGGMDPLIAERDSVLLISERVLNATGSGFELHELHRVDSALAERERFILYLARRQ
jgi:hypothetical protein